MPRRGWARHLERGKGVQPNEEQARFLAACWSDPTDGGNKVTESRIKEKMDAHFVGREELQFSEMDIKRWLLRVYARVRPLI